jgi:hypothetical protein
MEWRSNASSCEKISAGSTYIKYKVYTNTAATVGSTATAAPPHPIHDRMLKHKYSALLKGCIAHAPPYRASPDMARHTDNLRETHMRDDSSSPRKSIGLYILMVL